MIGARIGFFGLNPAIIFDRVKQSMMKLKHLESALSQVETFDPELADYSDIFCCLFCCLQPSSKSCP